MKRNLLSKLVLGAAMSLGIAAAATAPSVSYSDSAILKKAVHEVRMYSRYTLWDNINVGVREGNLELIGQVSEPFKKADLERIARRIPGVTSVTNELQVLPLSPNDDRLRLQVARAVYSDPVLSRYGIQAVPPIHIIVDNGRVTLEGVVNNAMEKNVAGIRASGAGLSFGPVINNLQVENPSKSKKG